jgi:hypothetical protein
MKKSILGAILGVATASAVYGQGHVLFSNYLTPPYNQVHWNANPSLAPTPGQANQAVRDFTIQFQLFYGEGTLTDPGALTPGQVFTLSPDFAVFDPEAGHGGGGYFVNIVQVLPGWAAGETFTFQYKVADGQGLVGESTLWQEMAQIRPTANAPEAMGTVPGLVVSVPEPSTFALLGLGSLAMLMFRRRQ